jgi:hypothetical protein
MNEMKKPQSTGEWELIAPLMAQALLNCTAGNRKTPSNRIGRMARDMENGKWLETGEPIQIDTNGKLINGHHRLKAIVEANTAQWLYVIRGVPTTARLVIDCGVQRSDADSFKMMGLEVATTKRLGAMKRAITGLAVAQHDFTKEELVEAWDICERSVLFAEEGMPTKKPGYQCASLLSPIIRAHLAGVSEAKLTRFKQPFINYNDDVCESKEMQPAYKLKVMIEGKKVKTSGTAEQLRFYGITTRALRYFLEGRELHLAIPEKEDIFELPNALRRQPQRMTEAEMLA